MILSAPTSRGALDDVEADSAEAEHDDVGAGLHPRRPYHRADACGDSAAYVADLVEWGVAADLGVRDLRKHVKFEKVEQPI
jgi:hypothetical protein